MSSDPATRRLWIGIPGPTLDDATRATLEDVRPGGVVLFRRNVASLDGVRALIRSLHGLLGPDLIVSVDHEGGLVTRFHRELTVFPGNMALGAAAYREPSMGEHLGEEQGELSARELRDLGIRVNLAPVLDLATSGDNPGITIRSFGAPAELAEKLGSALVRGTLRGGVLPTLKHFPGKGEATVDAHLDLPVIPDGDQDPHLLPFRAALRAGAPLVMTSHVIYRALDAERPATLSPAVVNGLLREGLGFEGVVVSDDLEMGAMRRHFGFDDVVQGACAAGHDVLCIAHDADLHRRAAALLRAGRDDGAGWYGDPDVVAARLDGLRFPAAPTPPDLARAASVAEAIAGRAITILRDEAGRIPVAGPCVLALPTLRRETEVEDPLRGEEDASALADALGETEIVRLSTEPTGEELDGLLSLAGDRTLLVGSTNARFLDGQRAYVRRCLQEHPRAVLLALRSPFDAEVAADLDGSVVLSYGFRAVQLRALAAVVRGATRAYGQSPV